MKLCDVLRPVLRRFPRQSMAALGYLGGGYGADPYWKQVRPRYRSYHDKQLDCIVSADLAEWGGRSCYYWGRFFDVTHQAVLRKYLSPGDTYIDIGANVGYQSMYASRLVGPKGQVLSFEPNPPTYSILSGHISINRLRNCRTFPMALSDSEGTAQLNQLEEHSGTSTLMANSQAVHSVQVTMRRGDDVLREIPFQGKTFIKIDVEGFELHVLRGLQQTLSRVDYVAVEVTPQWISQQGGRAEDLYQLMDQAGFTPLLSKLIWSMVFFNPKLHLIPLQTPLREQHDVIFVRKSSV